MTRMSQQQPLGARRRGEAGTVSAKAIAQAVPMLSSHALWPPNQGHVQSAGCERHPVTARGTIITYS